MSGKVIGCMLLAIIFFARAAGSYLKADMIQTAICGIIGMVWLGSAFMVRPNQGLEPKQESTGIPIGLILGFTLVPLAGLIWWNTAGPGAQGGSSNTSAVSTQAAKPAERSGPSVKDQKEMELAKFASSTTLHRADFVVEKYEHPSTLSNIATQIGRTEGVLGSGYTEKRDEKTPLGLMSVIYDSAQTSIDKITAPIEFGFKVKTKDVKDATISGAALKTESRRQPRSTTSLP